MKKKRIVNEALYCMAGILRTDKAFTLAEVLITLAVIGIVAALTIPVLIQKHNNLVVEARLVKFYRDINQAVQLAELEHGDKRDWFENLASVQKDENGTPIEGSSTTEIWFNEYLSPNLNIVKTGHDENAKPIFYFGDGSALEPDSAEHNRDWLFYPGDPEKCKSKEHYIGVCAFMFCYAPEYPDTAKERWTYHYGKGFEPYKYRWDGRRETLFTEGMQLFICAPEGTRNSYCTAIIQLNGWKIPKDYPYRVSY